MRRTLPPDQNMSQAASPIISVIVPVWNAAEFLHYTLSNIVIDQFSDFSPESWELILVNDGSTDGSTEIIQKWMQRWPQISLINQPNSGAATARNTGLKAARGEYVYFLDADDLLLSGTLSVIIEVACNYHPDAIKFCLRHITPEQYAVMRTNVPQATVKTGDFLPYTPSDYLQHTIGMTDPSGDCTVLTVYKHSLLSESNILFDSVLRIGEDVDFTWRALMKASSIFYAEKALHLYHLHTKSTSHNQSQSRLHNEASLCYLMHMLDIRNRFAVSPFNTGAGMSGLNKIVHHFTNQVIAEKVLMGDSYSDIRHTMLQIKNAGGDIHPGRPRFDAAQRQRADSRIKFRRWITAYFVAGTVWLKG